MRTATFLYALLSMSLLFAVGVSSVSAELEACPPLSSGTHIRPDYRYFDVSPRIVRADTEVTITITPRFAHRQPKPDRTYEATYQPTEFIGVKSAWTPENNKRIPIVFENGRFTLTRTFEGEQEHCIVIEEVKTDAAGKQYKPFGEFRVYSLGDDLFALRPYKGDIHMHSNRSDGVESPAYVAGACRRVGLDYMALSDHRAYDGSLEAIKAYEGVDVDLRMYPGEEVHTPDNPAHIVSFGARESITKQYADEAAYRAEVNALAAKLSGLPEGVKPFEYAACVWTFDKIRAQGGMGMLCHTYWFSGRQYRLPGPLNTCLMDNRPFDAFELISGMDLPDLLEADTNDLQIARYNEERAKGRPIPVCGISDAHGCETSASFGRNYTVCFAPSSDLADLIGAVRNLNSVAVETPHRQLPRAYGPFRLVKFTTFLLREVFPQHDEMCFEEGRQMIEYAAGDKTAAERLRTMKGQTASLYAKCWQVTAAPAH